MGIRQLIKKDLDALKLRLVELKSYSDLKVEEIGQKSEPVFL
jgi:hypothetical protein